ncbi:MAG: helix-turn-helix transcriptional regulator [Brevundimonas sp.]|uniref:helix-turn-helix domain-containing protein n=1 Tax=Brevundimonas sp. TaxID=1871086 RepID=UPI0027333604|nr:helix-turn-helix transcriptional regulator [Brevundimonas sp.]MDP3406194.1 helix-turn-helix transcriptional regulator [Brevundimonas sp.]
MINDMAGTLVLIASSAAAAIGLFAAAQLGIRRDWRTAPATALGVFLLLSALSGIDLILERTGVYAAAPAMTGVLWTSSLFLGPAILAYVVAMTGEPGRGWTPARVGRLAWPAIVAVVLALPFFLLPSRMRLAVYTGEGAGLDGRIGLVQLAFVALFLVVMLGYLAAAFRVLGRHVRRVRDLFSNIEDRTLSWLRVLLLVMLAAWIWGAIKSGLGFGTAQSAWMEFAAATVELCWIAAIGLFGLAQKPIFTVQTETPRALPAQGKYARSALPETRQIEIAGRLEKAMRAERLYRDPLLSLSALATRVAVSPNHLSRVLNDHLGQSFFDYVNRWRVEDAIARIRDGDEPILTIAFDVGFNSRSTFNAAVRKHTGRAPSAFRPEPRPAP